MNLLVHFIMGDQRRILVLYRYKSPKGIGDLIYHPFHMVPFLKIAAGRKILIDVHRRTKPAALVDVESRQHFLSFFYPVCLLFKRQK